MVPHVDTLGALVTVPAAPCLQNFTFETNVDTNILVDFFQKLREFVLMYLLINFRIRCAFNQIHDLIFLKVLTLIAVL